MGRRISSRNFWGQFIPCEHSIVGVVSTSCYHAMRFDYLDFLASEKKAKDWVEFDEWAVNLAKKKGFDRLTEEDVARIVAGLRSGR